MVVLGIESATNRVGCALAVDGSVLACVHTVRPRHHAESLTPQIRFLLDQAGLEPSDLSALAVDVGPGLFTGLRVGITTATAMAHALDIPVVPMTSLDLLAAATGRSDGEAMAVIDARRGEVFHARYRFAGGEIERITEPTVSLPEVLIGHLESAASPVLLVGDGVRAHSDVFAALDNIEIAEPGFDLPSPATLASRACAAVKVGEVVEALQVRPLYLREPDAKPSFSATGLPL